MTMPTPTPEQKAAAESLLKSFHGKLCPLLSINNFGKPPTQLVVGGIAASARDAGEAMGCQGPGCMWFVLTAGDPAGNATEGGCAAGILAQAKVVELARTVSKPTGPGNSVGHRK